MIIKNKNVLISRMLTRLYIITSYYAMITYSKILGINKEQVIRLANLGLISLSQP